MIIQLPHVLHTIQHHHSFSWPFLRISRQLDIFSWLRPSSSCDSLSVLCQECWSSSSKCPSWSVSECSGSLLKYWKNGEHKNRILRSMNVKLMVPSRNPWFIHWLVDWFIDKKNGINFKVLLERFWLHFVFTFFVLRDYGIHSHIPNFAILRFN